MPYRVELLPAARRNLQRLPLEARERIARMLEALAQEPRPAGAVVLQGTGGLVRVRVGDYRIVYDVQDDELRILVERIAHRRDVYRRLEHA